MTGGTVKIVYVGVAPAVDITVPWGAIRAEHGVPVEVPDSLATSLLEQDFEPAPAAKAAKNQEN